jgi:hypothetical protein
MLPPQGIPSLLALEIPAYWQTANSQGSAQPYPRDGHGKSTWAEERIANELKLNLAIQISPSTVGKYLCNGRPVRTPAPK